jgi:hypothetical protein
MQRPVTDTHSPFEAAYFAQAHLIPRATNYIQVTWRFIPENKHAHHRFEIVSSPTCFDSARIEINRENLIVCFLSRKPTLREQGNANSGRHFRYALSFVSAVRGEVEQHWFVLYAALPRFSKRVTASFTEFAVRDFN